MTFVSCLDEASKPILTKEMQSTLLKSCGSGSTSRKTRCPGEGFVEVTNYWIEKGPNPAVQLGHFVLTPSVEHVLKAVACAVSFHNYPLLLQGPTSAGKTSIVEYVAAITGHRFVRINNHEHTDLEEYLGGYVSDPITGKLVFREGALVVALRQGHWLVLDELNLAPSDVLEALNRLLDDNRELFIPETQQTVKPHPHFMLFATQNPPGAYGGRKVLSRAFTNRFLEINVHSIPPAELEIMLQQRCRMAASRSTKVVAVMCELQRHRQASAVFAGKEGFITPRDLFRWAGREPQSYQELAEHGYFILGERLRKSAEKDVVKDVLFRVMAKRDNQGSGGAAITINEEELYPLPAHEIMHEVQEAGLGAIAWTFGMRRLVKLVGECLGHKEAVLLVGETGCGKTTVCQIFAELRKQTLHIVNCHQHTDASDFIGGLRPVRGKERRFQQIREKLEALKSSFGEQCASVDTTVSDEALLAVLQQALASLTQVDAMELELLEELRALQREASSLFIWVDGPLVTAMRRGDMFLVDEISLADDAVLERLNSVLDPSATLTLAEKSGDEVEEIKAADGFCLLATMNPGGDFGKKELSPALRNRFTEVWVPSISTPADLQSIVVDRLAVPVFQCLVTPMVAFWVWYNSPVNSALAGSTPLSVRDMVSWTEFINKCDATIPPALVLQHGAELVLIDGIGIGTGLSPAMAEAYRVQCREVLHRVLAEVSVLRNNTSNWTDSLCAGWLASSSQQCPYSPGS